jgi:hypothetical protein
MQPAKLFAFLHKRDKPGGWKSKTSKIKPLAVAAVSAFLLSSVYYSSAIAGDFWRAFDPVAAAIKPEPWKAALELARTFAITYVLARLISRCAPTGKAALELGLWLWFGFSAMMWAGAVMWEGTKWQIAIVHSGDWLLKILLIMVILGFWRPETTARSEG